MQEGVKRQKKKEDLIINKFVKFLRFPTDKELGLKEN
jgi:hypothetical protein